MTKQNLAIIVLIFSVAILAVHCENKPKKSLPGLSENASTVESKSSVSPQAMEEAKTIFSQRCTPCHGPQGKGDGPASKGLTPPPRSFADKSWQQQVTDEHLVKVIKFGGAAVQKSPAMPPNPDLMAKDEVVNGLVQVVRELGK